MKAPFQPSSVAAAQCAAPMTRGGSARQLLLGLRGRTGLAAGELRGAPPRPAHPNPVWGAGGAAQLRSLAEAQRAPTTQSLSQLLLDGPKTEPLCRLALVIRKGVSHCEYASGLYS